MNQAVRSSDLAYTSTSFTTMFRACIIATLGCTVALVPQMKIQTETVVDRRALGTGLVSAASAFSAQAALAGAGDSPKFSFFGILGNAETYSEGAAVSARCNLHVFTVRWLVVRH